jgi:hypothetical protein
MVWLFCSASTSAISASEFAGVLSAGTLLSRKFVKEDIRALSGLVGWLPDPFIPFFVHRVRHLILVWSPDSFIVLLVYCSLPLPYLSRHTLPLYRPLYCCTLALICPTLMQVGRPILLFPPGLSPDSFVYSLPFILDIYVATVSPAFLLHACASRTAYLPYNLSLTLTLAFPGHGVLAHIHPSIYSGKLTLNMSKLKLYPHALGLSDEHPVTAVFFI